MNTTRHNGHLIFTDSPRVFWVFYSCFVLGGITTLVFSLSADPDTMGTVIGVIIGLGNIAGGIYMLWREPSSIVEIDKAVGQVRIIRKWMVGKREATYQLTALTHVEVETDEHTDGGIVYRPRLYFKTGSVPLSLFWYQNRESSEAVVGEIRDLLKEPSNNAGRADTDTGA